MLGASTTTRSAPAFLDDVAWQADVDAGVDPLELLPRPRRRRPAACASSPSTRAARATSTPTTGGWSTPSSGRGCASRCSTPDQPVRPPRAGVDAAVPAAARRPPPRGLGRGDLGGRVGPAGQVGRRAAAPGARPRALGGVARVVRRGDATCSRDVVTRPDPPSTVLMLGGDVHCSYTAVAELDGVDARRHGDPPADDVAVPQRHRARRQGRRSGCSTARAPPPSMHRLARWRKVADVGDALGRRARAVVRQRRDVDRARRPRRPAVALDQADVEGGRQVLRRTLDVELAPGTPSPDATVDDATATV